VRLVPVQGEGRAIALSKSVLLGEALPPLRLVFQDSHGNVVPVSGEGQQPAVTLQVLEAGPGNGGAVLQELQAEAELDAQSDGVNVQNLRLLGSAAASGAGMQLFKPAQPPAAASAGETAGAQRGLRGAARCVAGAAAGSGVPIVRAVDVYLAVHVDGMPQQVLLRVLNNGRPSSQAARALSLTLLKQLHRHASMCLPALLWRTRTLDLSWLCCLHVVCCPLCADRASRCGWRQAPPRLCVC
jgi:hypothetical protein